MVGTGMSDQAAWMQTAAPKIVGQGFAVPQVHSVPVHGLATDSETGAGLTPQQTKSRGENKKRREQGTHVVQDNTGPAPSARPTGHIASVPPLE